MTRLGIESTGDPFWFETLGPDRLRAVYGMLYAEDLEARDMAQATRRGPRRSVDPPPPPGSSSTAWSTLMSMRSDR